jgi:hypothetical protein
MYIKFNIATEVQKILKGRKSIVPIESLFHTMAPTYLETVSTSEEGNGKE